MDVEKHLSNRDHSKDLAKHVINDLVSKIEYNSKRTASFGVLEDFLELDDISTLNNGLLNYIHPHTSTQYLMRPTKISVIADDLIDRYGSPVHH